MLTLQCLKAIFGVNQVAILDIDPAKLQRVEEVYGSLFGDSLRTFHVTVPTEDARKALLQSPEAPVWSFRDCVVEHKMSEYVHLLHDDNAELDELIQATRGAFARAGRFPSRAPSDASRLGDRLFLSPPVIGAAPTQASMLAAASAKTDQALTSPFGGFSLKTSLAQVILAQAYAS